MDKISVPKSPKVYRKNDTVYAKLEKERDDARELLRTALDFSNIAIWELDTTSDELRWEGDYASVWGEDALDTLKTGDAAFARMVAEDRDIVRTKLAESIKFDTPYIENFRINHPDGTVHWLAGRGNHRIVNGRMIVTGINYDITEAKTRELKNELLTMELHHRMRNLFAKMRAIISLTKNSAHSIDDYVERIESRLRALDRAQNVLLNANFLTGSLHALMREMTDGFPRIHWNGPDIKMPENALVALALVLNELATNAAKYGALSVRGGHVKIAWVVEQDPTAGSGAVITWDETGGPSLLGPPDQRGFGSQLIERSVRDNLKGTIIQNWSLEGLSTTITMPINWDRN